MLRTLLLWGMLMCSVGLAYGQVNRTHWFPKIKYNDLTRTSRDFYSIYLMSGPSTYHGDMADIAAIFPSGRFGYNFQEIDWFRFSAGVNYRLRSFHPLTIRTEASFYQIEATDFEGDHSWRRNKRQLSFRARNWELWMGPMVDVFRYGGQRGVSNVQYRVIGYVYAGVGATTVLPTAVYEGQRYELWKYPLESESYDPVAMIFPLGLGVKLRFEQGITLGMDFGYRVTTTDHLDNVSNQYVDASAFTDPALQYLADPTGLHSPGDLRGDPTNDDGYMFTSVSVEYNFQNGSFRPRNNRYNNPYNWSGGPRNLGEWFRSLFSGRR